jgi:hypothetical protein
MRIEQVIGFSSLVLVVYYMIGQCWQYEIAFDPSWLSAGKKGRYNQRASTTRLTRLNREEGSRLTLF